MRHTSNKKPSFNPESGMTLLELVIAAGILGVGFTLLIGSLLSITVASASSEDRATGASHIATVLEEIRAGSQADFIAYLPPALEELGAGEQVSIVCFAADGSEVAVPVTSGSVADALPNPVEVQVTVTWLDPQGRSVSTSASTFVGW